MPSIWVDNAPILNTSSGITGIQNLITQQDNQSNATPTKPRAFINVIFFDEQFKSYDYRLSIAGSSSQVKDHFADLQNIAAAKSGYVYIYCSNESPVDVFFDNLQIIHTRGRILEENHYYSYGLKIAAFSGKAAGTIQNRNLYQGDFSEYDEETGYNEFDLRHYDAQVGRWLTTDPQNQHSSPYIGMNNNPTQTIDTDGGWGWIANTITATAGGAVVGGLISKASGGEFWEGATIGGIYGAGIGAAVSYGLNLNGIQDNSGFGWGIVSNGLLSANVNLTTKLLEGYGVKSAALSGLVGLGTGGISAVIAGKQIIKNRDQFESPEVFKASVALTIGGSLNGLIDRFIISKEQGRSSPFRNSLLGLSEGLLSGVFSGVISGGALSFSVQNLLSSGIAATPGLSLRLGYWGSMAGATAFGIVASEGELFEGLNASWNKIIGISILSSELYLFKKSFPLHPFFRSIDYPDYFQRFY